MGLFRRRRHKRDKRKPCARCIYMTNKVPEDLMDGGGKIIYVNVGVCDITKKLVTDLSFCDCGNFKGENDDN